jgi:lysophospholipase L1-like esterase
MFKKIVLPVGASVASICLYQAFKVRRNYVTNYRRTEEPLPGPHFGMETVVKPGLLANMKEPDGIYEKGLNHIKRLISRSKKVEHEHDGIIPTISNRRRIKLVILGDSLVFGVGCDQPKSIPILPQFLAKVISNALNADVDWISDGKVGGTVSSIRSTVLPAIKRKLLRSYRTEENNHDEKEKEKMKEEISSLNHEGVDVPELKQKATELIVIVICGLNDWKETFESFPFGFGPVGFKDNLGKLVDEIKDIGQQIKLPCKVFLPSLPLTCTLSDPQCSFRAAPLYQIFRTVSWVWDQQKHALAFDDPKEATAFIGSPRLDSEYAVPGEGNISSDGIHPTNQGYKWWAMHLAEEICMSINIKPTV